MAKSHHALLVLSCYVVFLVLPWIPVSHCTKKPVGVARKEDIPYIKCQVCEKLASQLYHQVQARQAEISPKKVLGYSDTDVAEYLYKNKPQLDSLVNYICKDLTKACRSEPPPVPKDRIPGEPFIAKSTKEAEMERLMKSMEGIPGAPGMKMYSREDLMNQNFGDEDAEDDDDDGADFPSKLGKVLRDKDAKKYDWKEQITRGAMDVSQTLKGHANRVSNRIRQWWKGTKTNWKKKSKSGRAEL
ncbi:uncharacterized protein LOC142546091 isoform X2 [Primulina tabacum]|uniref:uncharacterized protein LOC142546091 isoform X2 n=1 Tax=Primulina tabacum TaxID=48773 RepID=UPI003F59E141